MTIVRVVQDKKKPFILVKREILQDKNLNLEALGFYLKLLSLEIDELDPPFLTKQFNLPLEKVNELSDQLKKLNYLGEA